MQEKKVISIEDRLPQLKKKRKKKANRRFFTFLTIILLLISLIVYLQSPLSYLKSIDIINNDSVSDEEIIELSMLRTDQPFWNISMNEIVNNITKHPEIIDVKVERKWYNRLIIKVFELRRVGYVNLENSFYPILENGYILDNQSLKLPKGDAAILYHFTNEEILEKMANQLAQLEESVGALISEIFWEPDNTNEYRVRLYMRDGQEVIASIINFQEKMAVYPSIASQLDPNIAGILYLDIGAYFQPFSLNDEGEQIEFDLEEGIESSS